MTLKTVEWKNNSVVMIDQTKLPNTLEYVTFTDYNQLAEAIRTLVVRGAPAIGVSGAFGLALAALQSSALEKNQFKRALDFYIQMTSENAIGHFILLPLLIERANKNEKEIIEDKLIQMVSDNPETEIYFSMLFVMKPEIENKILFRSFKKQIIENTLVKEIINQNNNFSSDIIDDDLIDNIKLTINKKTINDYKYNCSAQHVKVGKNLHRLIL